MDAGRLENRVVIAHVALVINLDQHVAPAMVEQPAGSIVRGSHHCGFVLQSFILPKIEKTDDDDHAEVVGAVDDALQPGQVIGT
jgi:hypothetical protein